MHRATTPAVPFDNQDPTIGVGAHHELPLGERLRRAAAAGERVRVYVPYGDDWYGYFMRRMAERPANTMFFLRAIATKG